MKFAVLCCSFVRKNIIPMIITMLMMTVSMFVLSTFYGEYRYITYTKNVLLNSGLDNGVYFMLNYDGDPERNTELSYILQQKTLDFEGCSKILTNKWFPVTDNAEHLLNVRIYNKEMRNHFKLRVVNGRWLSDQPDHTEIVIGGSVSGDNKVGDYLTLKNGITAEIVGIMDDVVISPSFSASSNSDQTANLLFASGNNTAFITEETLSTDELSAINNISCNYNFYVIFNDDNNTFEKNELISFLESNGMVVSYDKIIGNSNLYIVDWISGAFPLPLFLITISTISIICICTVIVKKSMPDCSKYYLLGLTKRKGTAILSVPLTVLFGIPCILNIVSVTWFPDFLRAGVRTGAVNYILGASAAIPILIYMLLIVLILILLPLLFYRKFSPMAFYRRNL